MLGNDHSWNEFKHFSRSLGRPAFEQLGADRALGRGVACAHRVVIVASNLDGIELCSTWPIQSEGKKRRKGKPAGTRTAPCHCGFSPH
jgi:hypothetical protein